MSRRRPRWAVAAVSAVGCLVAACSATASMSSTGTTKASSRSPAWSVVSLGDSVPRGTNCGCTPYPALTAEELARQTGETVTATNDSVAGATTSSVLRQLDKDDVIAHLRTADTIEIEIGANDVGYSRACGTRTACYAPRIPTIRRHLAAIVARVRKLSAGHPALIVLLDYWSVWLGGRYAAAHGKAYVSAAEQMTDEVNSVIKSTAAASGSAYVDLRAAFKGPSYTYDETHYLSTDGDHPNKAGHNKIATATQTAIEKAMHV